MPAQYHKNRSSATAIAENIERDIDAGRFAHGDTLPTIRTLAADLGVSPTTVNAAFALLRRNGRIVGKRRGGSVVVSRLPLQAGAPIPSQRGRNLAVANPDPAFLPALKPVVARFAGERRLYTDIADDPALLALFRSQLTADGIDATHLGVASGAMDAIERGLMAITQPGDVVALEDPCYPPFATLAQALGLQIVRMPVDSLGITPAALTTAIRARTRAIVIVPRAHNPTGATFDARRARALRTILAKAGDVAVLEDDYLAALAGTAIHSLSPACRRWLHVRSLAKTVGPDIRVAPFAADALTLARIVARQRIGCGWVSTLLQETAAALLRSPVTKRLIATATSTYAKRRSRFVQACRSIGLDASGESGFTVWVRVADEATAIASALAAGFLVDAGSRYRDATPPAVRVTITTLESRDAVRLSRALAVGSSMLP